MYKNMFLKKLVSKVRDVYGGNLSTPKNFFCLSLEINDKCGESISVATIKRLFSYVKYESTPSLRTLDILSCYIGYKNYKDFCDKNLYIDKECLQIGDKKFSVGDVIFLNLQGDSQMVKFQYMGGREFRICT